ncbi:uncharacterized protein LOC127283757 [Leptopilina boulardi]|uniref:uncharacterized protein LOC127283757 n=1 Tax=Leptopilina boulardi TaxID=63433 RepID=UPI0021F55C69|nr:uncharacterized protein LOC127283757 [Leptopilina boulardi]
MSQATQKQQEEADEISKILNLSKGDLQLGMFFFGCNIPFAVVESDFLKKFVKTLNPNYSPPTRKTLSNSI